MPNQTGPRTDEGKKTSSQNNRHHGLATANIIVAPAERQIFDQIEAELRDEIKPDGPLENIAFRRLITANWQMEKCQQHEAVLVTQQAADQTEANRELEKLRRYYLRWEGSFNSAFRQIRLLQTDRACQAYMSGNPPDYFPPIADLPKIEQYARRIASHNSFEGKVRDVLIDELANGAPKPVPPSRTSPQTATTVRPPSKPASKPINPTLCETKSSQPEVGLGRRSPGEVGRNSPCPCGSGRKFKRCCGPNAAPVLNHGERPHC